MTTMLATTEEILNRLARFTSPSDPVVSLYLNLRADEHGHRDYENFVDHAFHDQISTFEPGSAAPRYLEEDAQRVRRYIDRELQPSCQALAVFSCSGDPALFDAIQLNVPIDGHRLYIDRHPHLFPLARVTDQYTTYAALLVNTNAARLYVFALGTIQRKVTMQHEKPTRTSGVDVWSEGEYQRNRRICI